MNGYICGLDIGSSKISAAVAKMKNGRVADIFFETIISKGVKRGVINDSIELIDSIGKIIKKLKSVSGINIKIIYADISGEDITAGHSSAVLPLAERGNRVITMSDIRRVDEQARILSSSIEEEIIHKFPCAYSIDSRKGILNPLELYSHRLEVDLYLIRAKTAAVQNFNRAINQAGYEMKGLFFSGIATAKAVFGGDIGQGINALCDIGGDITELVLFDSGRLRDIQVLPLGGDDLTSEVSNALKIPFNLAEEIKKSSSLASGDNAIDGDKEILIKNNDAYSPIKQKSVSETLMFRLESICREIKKAVEKQIPCSRINNFTVTGRAALLDGFIEVLESRLGTPVNLARIGNPVFSGVVNKHEALFSQKNLLYITALGIIGQVIGGGDRGMSNAAGKNNFFLTAANKIKEIYKEYF